MGNLVPTTPGSLASGERCLPRVASSRAWAEALDGDNDLAGRLARRLGPALPTALDEACALLVPASPEAIMGALSPLLALTAGAWMTEDDREEWFAAAADGLHGVPVDLLERGKQAARKVADHPSKVLPAMLAEIEGPMRARRRDREMAAKLLALANSEAVETKAPDYATPEQAAAIIDEFGLRPAAERRRAARPDGPARAPTAEELRDLLPSAVAAAVDVPIADITGLNLEQILAQAARLKAERLGLAPARPAPAVLSPEQATDDRLEPVPEEYQRFFG